MVWKSLVVFLLLRLRGCPALSHPAVFTFEVQGNKVLDSTWGPADLCLRWPSPMPAPNPPMSMGQPRCVRTPVSHQVSARPPRRGARNKVLVRLILTPWLSSWC